MNKLTILSKVIFCLMITSYSLYGQTASVTAGCAELKVEFSAPVADSYFWVFGDGVASVSTLRNPVHSYLQPGTWIAQLFDERDGNQIGEDIEITVFPRVEIDINADAQTGCAPLTVNFTSDINAGDIEIEDIVWTFGDGSSASGADVSYTYPDNGVFTVSIKVIAADDVKCDEPVIFEDFISLEGDRITFNINQTSSCEVPDDFVFTNTTEALPGSTYFWDFGNGETRDTEGPHIINYTEPGVYNPILTITSPGGCESSLRRTISLGPPVIVPTYPDTICFGAEVVLNQATVARDFLWDFSTSDIDSTFSPVISMEKRPNVLFTEPGLQTFTLTATAPDGCQSIETLSIFVHKPDASFIVGPDISCVEPILIEYTANDMTHALYTFNNDVINGGEDIERETANGVNIYEPPERDIYHINTLDSVTTRLIVTTAQGCIDTAFQKYFIQKPEAFFLTDVVKGCIPFEVNFEDLSFSEFEVDTRFWDYGDGQQAQFGQNDTLTSHIYNTPGLHEAVLTVTDVNGCKDISREVQIIAIAKDTIPGTPVPGACPDPICVGDTLKLNILQDQINISIHIESDDGRYNHCWRDRDADHAFLYPGSYPLNYTVEFADIFIDSFRTGCILEVLGSHSEIDFEMDCSNPFQVQFTGEESINADQFAWYLEDELISNQESFSHTFTERGEYMVYLDTEQNNVGCSHRDSALIHITDVQARLNIPELTCASNPVILDSSPSIDVSRDCRSGFTWIFENQRPRVTSNSSLSHMLLPGFQRVTLVVEDVNGCRDTTSATTTAYEVDADFSADTLICLPSNASLTNLTATDTTIASYSWEFGGGSSSIANPNYEFTESDYDPDFVEDTISIFLTVTDVIGCFDTMTLLIETYDIVSEISTNNGPVICQNESILFDAADFTQMGSFLNFNWDFAGNGTSEMQTARHTFTEVGDQIVTLTFTEDATGCISMLDTLITVTPNPTASFVSDQDDQEFICFPEQIQFTNTSDIGSAGAFLWDFGNGAQSDLENPLIPFDKGTWEVQLITFTLEGCSDTTTQSFTLVGPEGDFTASRDEVCPGEPITFTVNNVTDVESYTWDFGDGTQVDNQSPVTHVYDAGLGVELFTPILILRSDEEGCDLELDLPITVSSITANIIVDTTACPGEIRLMSDFVNPQTIEWNIDGQIITGTSSPSVPVDTDRDSIDITLNVTDANGCEVTRMRRVANIEAPEDAMIRFPNVFSPNGDLLNPYFNVFYNPLLDPDIIEVTDFRVYNRWGELLYNNENPSIGWDGRYKGVVVPPDVYAYFIEVSIDGCMTRSKKGNVTVIK